MAGAVSHVFSNTIANWTGTVTVGNSDGNTMTQAATALVRPQDWNSVHNMFLTLGGNTTNQSTFSGTRLDISAGPGIIAAITGNTLELEGSYFGEWPPIRDIFMRTLSSNLDSTNTTSYGVTTGAAGGTTQITMAQLKCFPFHIPGNLYVNNFAVMVVWPHLAGTNSHTIGCFAGLYTLSGATLSLVTNLTFNHVMHRSANSASAQTWRWYAGTDSGANSSQVSGNVSNSFTGGKILNLLNGVNSLIPLGPYFMVWGMTSRSAGAAGSFLQYQTSNEYFMPFIHTSRYSPLNASSHNQVDMFGPIGGFSSTFGLSSMGLPCLPDSIHTSVFTTSTSAASLQLLPWVWMNRLTI